jgi:hypothetical protein
MRVLLVTPIEEGSGETITAVHIGDDLRHDGNEVLFLASSFARRFIEPQLPGLTVELGQDAALNLDLWRRSVAEFAPDAVIFADYPLMFVPHGVAPLVREPGWLKALRQYRGCLLTLDHFGFAQQEMGLFFGPPHLTPLQYQRFEAIPERMEILLPCPMHEPRSVTGRRGHPFRYWDVPLLAPARCRGEIRQKYLGDSNDFLIFHAVPNWAWQAAEVLQLPFYRYLPKLLDHYLGGLPKPVTVVSVNNGELLDPAGAPRLRIINLPPISVPEFEAVLFGSNLMITENRISISLGKAVCGLQVCAALINRQSTLELATSPDATVRQVVFAMESHRLASVYPFEVFPTGMTDLLKEIVLYKENSLPEAICDLEVFGGESTREMFRRLLIDDSLRADFRARQQEYVRNLSSLPRVSELISNLSRSVGEVV